MACSGAIGAAKDKLKESLANSYYFRRWQNNRWSVAEAKEHIYFDALPPPPNGAASYTRSELEQMRPFAIVYSNSFRLDGTESTSGFQIGGELGVIFEENVPHTLRDDPGEAERQFEDWVNQVMYTGDSSTPGLAELSANAAGTYLSINTMEADGPYRIEESQIESKGDHQRFELRLDWGNL